MRWFRRTRQALFTAAHGLFTEVSPAGATCTFRVSPANRRSALPAHEVPADVSRTLTRVRNGDEMPSIEQ